MVCNASEWRWLVEEPTLRDKVALVRNIWYYADGEETKGPINLSELRRRFEAGDLDGLTRVYWREEWSAIAEIPGLRELLIMAGSLQSLEQNQMLQDDDSDTSLRPPDELPVSTECKNQDEDDGSETERKQKKNKKRKRGFDRKAAKCWVYVENLPLDTTLDEIAAHFSKCGILATDLDTMGPRIKLYKDESGQLKGDASVCYAHETSVELALTILDGSSLRYGIPPLKVTRADFSEQRLGAFDESKGATMTDAARLKIAKQVARQRRDWRQDEDAPQLDFVPSKDKNNTSLRIVVIPKAFNPKIPNDIDECENRLLERIRSAGASRVPDKITIFSNHAIALIKFASSADARLIVEAFDGATFWDGITDYSKQPSQLLGSNSTAKMILDDEDDEIKRLNQFGSWLDQQYIPPELQPKIEDDPSSS
eukprot:CAMPEP_0197298376 /NCGR_PEP_ID=MMETSP0890-20130614/43343_1 /TAXON_ID=44058 ORGANISM="Aureoumbra lagunensis, Strain CCMP1510" /NCGR_SAMPLE_ID=MMETSP0890 /ASSEMBLY_ACC=CAM_ASM_000533 /LENGTH=424 /DNA_ID=CAMNT_0042776101 /DNA_START=69 /DNA_END=1343 /DNA_ORIENTATION=+